MLHEEAALALGSTRWEMVQLAVFPYARSGVVSAILLGLGRALGETMAVAMIISPAILVSFKLTMEGESSQTIAANIALNFPIASGLQRDALIGTGLVLFVISLAVNMLARLILNAKPGGWPFWRRARPSPKAVAIAAAEAGAETAFNGPSRGPASVQPPGPDAAFDSAYATGRFGDAGVPERARPGRDRKAEGVRP